MTREEEIINASKQHKNPLFSNYGDAFEAGAKWADEHPKSSWINCKDKMPYEFENLLEDTRHTVKVLVYNAEENSIDIDWMYRYVCDDNNIIWKWFDSVSSCITHWMPLPDKPQI